MALFVDDNDARATFVRMTFNRELGREPSGPEMQARVAELAGGGRVDQFLAEIRDSTEAQNFRNKRGW